MANTLDKEFLDYFVRLDEPQKLSLLQMVKAFLGKEDQPLPNTTIEDYNKDLDEAMARMDKGEFISIEELEKEMFSCNCIA